MLYLQSVTVRAISYDNWKCDYISKDLIQGIGKCTYKCMQDFINFGQRDTCMGLKLSSSHILYVAQIKCTYLSYQLLCDAK